MSEFNLYHFTNLDDANKQGFKAGLHNTNAPFKNAVNDYQKEYNRGNESGKFIRRCVLGC